MHSAYVNGELDLAKTITDKKKMALRNPCDLFTMAHADAILHELSSFGTSIHLRNTQRALALECLSEHSAGAGQDPPEGGAGSSALVPRRSAPAPRDQFCLVHHVTGAGSSADSYHDERPQLYDDYAGLSSF